MYAKHYVGSDFMEILWILGAIAVFILFGYMKEIVWDKPRDEIRILKNELQQIKDENIKLKNFYEQLSSNKTAIPYMAKIIADIETFGLEKLALGLDWGYAKRRLEKVKSIREIRKDARAMIEKYKDAQYQLSYLLELFPNLSDIIECEFEQLPMIEVSELSDYDTTRDYLSKEEYASLSTTERNQLALDRYNNSHNKTKWQTHIHT